MGEMPSSDYTLLKSPIPAGRWCMSIPTRKNWRRVYRPTLAINASPSAFVEAFAKRKPGSAPSWADETAKLHAAYLDWSTPPESGPGPVHMGPIMDWSARDLPADVILTNGAGNYATWVHRFHRSRRFATQAAPTSGSMGYGTPAAVAAKALYPDRERHCLCRRWLLPDERPGIRHRRAI